MAEFRAVEESWQIPHEKLVILAKAGVFTLTSRKFTIHVDADGNFQEIIEERKAYKRKKQYPIDL